MSAFGYPSSYDSTHDEGSTSDLSDLVHVEEMYIHKLILDLIVRGFGWHSSHFVQKAADLVSKPLTETRSAAISLELFPHT